MKTPRDATHIFINIDLYEHSGLAMLDEKGRLMYWSDWDDCWMLNSCYAPDILQDKFLFMELPK